MRRSIITYSVSLFFCLGLEFGIASDQTLCDAALSTLTITKESIRINENQDRAKKEIIEQIKSGNTTYLMSLGKKLRDVALQIKANPENYQLGDVLSRFLNIVIQLGQNAKSLAPDLKFVSETAAPFFERKFSSASFAKEALEMAMLRIGVGRLKAIRDLVVKSLDAVFTYGDRVSREKLAKLEPTSEELAEVMPDLILPILNKRSEAGVTLISEIANDQNRAFLAEQCFDIILGHIRAMRGAGFAHHQISPWLNAFKVLIPAKVPNQEGLKLIKEYLDENQEPNRDNGFSGHAVSIANHLGIQATPLLPNLFALFERRQKQGCNNNILHPIVSAVAAIAEKSKDVDAKIINFLKSGLENVIYTEEKARVSEVLFRLMGDSAIAFFVEYLAQKKDASLALEYSKLFPDRVEFLPVVLEIKKETTFSFELKKIQEAIERFSAKQKNKTPSKKPSKKKSEVKPLKPPKIPVSKAPRTFARISIEDLRQKIEKAFEQNNESYLELNSKVKADLRKVDFNDENVKTEAAEDEILGYHELENGLTYFGVIAAGDWEPGVFFIIYWDGSSLRGYIPQYGNLWNTETKAAFGNNEDKDNKNARKRAAEFIINADADIETLTADRVDANSNLLLEDIRKRFGLE